MGYSSELKSRLKAHEVGRVKETKQHTFELCFYAAFRNKLKALHFERYLKEGSGVAFRNKHLL